jgi:hypothetical protein
MCNPLPFTATAAAATGDESSTYYYAPNQTIPLNMYTANIDCGQRDENSGQLTGICKICNGGLKAVLAECNQRAECVAVHMEAPAAGSKQACGYLRSAWQGLTKPMPGHSMYFKGEKGPGSFKLVPDTETRQQDISCGYVDEGGARDFCKVCGGVTAVIGKCNSLAEKCVAVNMEDDDCGYLKAAPIFTERTEFMSYQKL